MDTGILTAIITASAAVIAALIAIVPELMRRQRLAAKNHGLRQETTSSSVEVTGSGLWRDKIGQNVEVPVKGFFTGRTISLYWLEPDKKRVWETHLKGQSDDGTHFSGTYGYPEINDYGSFELEKHSIENRIILAGT